MQDRPAGSAPKRAGVTGLEVLQGLEGRIAALAAALREAREGRSRAEARVESLEKALAEREASGSGRDDAQWDGVRREVASRLEAVIERVAELEGRK